MKHLIIILVAICTVFSLGYLLDSSSIPEDLSQNEAANKILDTQINMPLFSYKDLSGNKFKIEDLKGKIIILNFWASWCGPCKEEFPEMLQIVKENKNVVLLAISNDENKRDVLKFLKNLKKEGTNLKQDKVIIALDNHKEISSELFNVLRLPETFIINKDFKIIKKVIGSQFWVNKDMSKFIQTLN